jgi:hypothetical protein
MKGYTSRDMPIEEMVRIEDKDDLTDCPYAPFLVAITKYHEHYYQASTNPL